MRILMTTDTVGGVWTFTKELTSELLQRGYEVALVSFGGSPSNSQSRWCETTSGASHGAFKYEFSLEPLEWMDDNDRAYVSGERVLLRTAKMFDPDIFLSSQFCFGSLALDIPKIVVAHSDVLSWAKACRKAPLEPSEWLATYCALVASGISGATCIVAPTEWMLSALSDNFRLPPSTCVIPNGRTLTKASAVGARKLQAVVAGRLWDEAKNVAILKEIKSPIPILIAGDFDSCSFHPMSDLKNLTFIGAQSEENLMARFRESAIYVCPSIYEPFGLAPLEAALCGCAVVANEIPSLREVWGDGALYFYNTASLSALLNRLTNQPQLLASAQERSAARAQHFTSANMASKYTQLFDRLLVDERGNVDAA